MTKNLIILAGHQALPMLRDEGLRPERIKVMAGAAGGPKWLVLNGLDRTIFGSWFKNRTDPLYLVGASIGAWRFAAAARSDPLAGLQLFEDAYINQRYSARPSLDEIGRETERIHHHFLPDTALDEVLNHPVFRLNILTVRCRGPVTSENKAVQGLGFLAAMALNAVKRNWLSVFFERVLLYDPRDQPPFLGMDQFPMHRVALEPRNLKPALAASGAIPMLMPGVRDIPGAPPGLYRDAGILDYHLDIPFLNEEGLVLYPHFSSRIIPGWLDKNLPRRQPDPRHLGRVVLLAPSPEFVENLPLAKIPDRNDFWLFKDRDDDRIKYWQAVREASRRLADDFMEAVDSGRIRDLVRPLTP
jgi:hypothetical protein